VACTNGGDPPQEKSAVTSKSPAIARQSVEAAQANAQPASESACLHEPSQCAQEAPPTSATSGHFGDAFQLREAQSLTSALHSLTALKDGESSDILQIKGTIGPVCQKRGCWMMLEEGEAKVRVIMARGAFSVPRDGKGKAALVEGTIKARELSPAQVKHLAQDEGQPADSIPDESRREYILTAHAVQVGDAV
jgi:hypothetical protein